MARTWAAVSKTSVRLAFKIVKLLELGAGKTKTKLVKLRTPQITIQVLMREPSAAKYVLWLN